MFKWFAVRLPSHKLKWIKAQGRVGALKSQRLSEKASSARTKTADCCLKLATNAPFLLLPNVSTATISYLFFFS